MCVTFTRWWTLAVFERGIPPHDGRVRDMSWVTMANADSSPAARPGLTAGINRMLRLFGDVSVDETRDVLLMFLNVYLLLVAYYVLKTVREPLILATGGAELKSYAAAAQAAVLLFYVPLYGGLASRLPVNRLVTWVNLGMAACIQIFFLTGLAGLPYVGFAFYVFVGIFSLTLVAQFWSFANDIYLKAEGDRLFPVIAVGATAGAPLGAALASALFARGISPWVMMQIATGLLLAHTAVYRLVRRRGSGQARKSAKGSANGFALVFASPYLRLIALLLVILNIINTTGEYVLANLVTTRANALAAEISSFNRGAFIGQFYGQYFFGVNVLSVLLQMFVVSRIVKRLGMAGVLFTLPVVALGAYGLAMSGAGIVMVRWLKTAENAADYSVMNTAKQMLWLPTTREEKYAGKQAIDTFFVRSGDLLSAAVVFIGTRGIALSTEQFAATNVAFVVIALIVSWLLLREYGRLTGETVPAGEKAGSTRLAEARG
jgi:ATP:ADP antiporter, AAA family